MTGCNSKSFRNKVTNIKQTNHQYRTLRELLIENRKRVTTGRGLGEPTREPCKQVKTDMKRATEAAGQTTPLTETQQSTSPVSINFLSHILCITVYCTSPYASTYEKVKNIRNKFYPGRDALICLEVA